MILSSTEEIGKKIDSAIMPGLQGGPHNHTTAAIAVALKEAATPEFKTYAVNVVANAKVLAEELMARGFDLISGGTDNHLILIDLTNKEVRGKPAAKALDRAGLELNFNAVPFDERPPANPSGLRIGTPAVTSRGMGPDEMREIARFMDEAVNASKAKDEDAIERIFGEVKEMTSRFPAPGIS